MCVEGIPFTSPVGANSWRIGIVSLVMVNSVTKGCAALALTVNLAREAD